MTNNLYRHTAVAIDRHHIRPGREEESEDEEENSHDEMAAHTTAMGNARYARVRNLTSTLTPESIDLCRAICDREHAWLGMAARDAKCTAIAQRQNRLLTARERKEETDRIMAEMYGFNWKWKSEKQRESVELAAARISPLFIILPMGGGKTLSFMVAAKMKGSGVTVVVTPLIALGKDMVRRFQQVGLDTILYSQYCQRRAKIVVVVTETAGHQDFQQYVMDLQLEGVLDRVVYDEAHKLISDRGYRPYITESRKLGLRCQIMFITGTCPEELVAEICEEMVVPKPHIVQEEYFKPTFVYLIKVCENVQQTVKEYLRLIKQVREERSKCLVFCRFKTDAERYAREYDARKYYSGQSTNEKELAAWKGGLLFATSALGAGIDIEWIEDVVHIKAPYGLLDYIQESGRGGRGGETVHCTIIISLSDYLDLMKVPRESLSRDEAALQDFLRGDICRNKIITSYLNGKDKGKTCAEGKGMLCDVCQGRGQYRELKRKQDERTVAEREEVKRRKSYEDQVRMKEDEVRRIETM